MEKLLKLNDRLMFVISLATLFFMPALFSRLCYSHCNAPKDFAFHAAAAAITILAAARVLSGVFRSVNFEFKIQYSLPLLSLYYFASYLSFINTPSDGLTAVKALYLAASWAWLVIFYVFSKRAENIEKYLLTILLSGLPPAIFIILESAGIRAFELWENISSAGLTVRETYVSTFGNPDFAAPFFGAMAILNIRFFIYSDNSFKSWFYGFTLLAYLTAWLLPMCRSAQIAFLASFLLYSYFVKKAAPEKLRHFINIAVLIAVVAFSVQFKDMVAGKSETLFSRGLELFFSQETTSKRLYMLAAGVELVKAHPLAGCGMNTLLMNFPIASQNIDPKSGFLDNTPYHFNTNHLHNEMVNIAAESGLISLLIYCAACAALLYHGFKTASAGKEKSGLAAVLTCLVVYLIVDSMFNVTFTLSHMNMLFAAFAAFLINSSDYEKKSLIFFRQSNRWTGAIIALLMTLAALFSSVAALKAIRADWYMMRAKIWEGSQQKAGALDEAQKCYRASLELNPFRAEPYYFSAEIYKAKGDFENAVRYLKAASNLNLSLPIIYELARLAIRHLDLNSEMRYLYFLTRSYPRFDEAHYLLGLRYLKEKRTNKAAYGLAESSIKTAARLNPKHLAARMTLAEIYFETGKSIDALAELDEVIKIDPAWRNAHYLRSLIKGFWF